MVQRVVALMPSYAKKATGDLDEYRGVHIQWAKDDAMHSWKRFAP